MSTQPIIFKNLLAGIFAAIFGVMIPLFVGLGILFHLFGLVGEDSGDTLTILALPFSSVLFSILAFPIGVLPFAFLGKWVGNRSGMSPTSGEILAVSCSAILGGALGCTVLDWRAVLLHSLFLGASAFAFWRFVKQPDLKPQHE